MGESRDALDVCSSIARAEHSGVVDSQVGQQDAYQYDTEENKENLPADMMSHALRALPVVVVLVEKAVGAPISSVLRALCVTRLADYHVEDGDDEECDRKADCDVEQDALYTASRSIDAAI